MMKIETTTNETYVITAFRFETRFTALVKKLLDKRNRWGDPDNEVIFYKEIITYRVCATGEEFLARTGDVYRTERPSYTLTSADGRIKIGTGFTSRQKVTKFLTSYLKNR